MQLKPGAMIGGWRISHQIGKGGNGVVYEATDGQRVAAVKILTATGPKRSARFADEIRAMERCKDLPGVLPLYESFLTHGGKDQPPWFAMPLAVRLTDALAQGSTFEHVIAAIRDIAAALVAIHERKISHRDIKPDNLFLLNEQWAVGDFGLADFEGKESETAPMEKVGPVYYIAPEMLNDASAADGKAADVYSLAKTMWVLGSGQKFPLPGHQLASIDAMTISAYTDHPRAALLNRLLENSTNFDPKQRPTMQQFLREIDAWSSELKLSTAPDPGDLGAFRRRLEGRLRKIEENEQATTVANQRSNSEGMRVRERFRGIANSLCQRLAEAGLLPPSLQIDNYHYGFEILATVPYEPGISEFHRIKITLHTSPNADGSQFVLEAWCKHSRSVGNESSETELWHSKRDFFCGGSDEEDQVTTMIQDLNNMLVPAIEKVLAEAGVL